MTGFREKLFKHLSVVYSRMVLKQQKPKTHRTHGKARKSDILTGTVQLDNLDTIVSSEQPSAIMKMASDISDQIKKLSKELDVSIDEDRIAETVYIRRYILIDKLFNRITELDRALDTLRSMEFD